MRSTLSVRCRATRWSTLAVACALGAAGLVAGGTGVARASPERVPAELVATVAFGPASARDSLRAYAESFSPGGGAVFAEPVLRQRLAKAAEVSSLDGFDPAYVLVTEIDRVQIALVGAVVDRQALTTAAGASHVVIKGRWAVVGPEPVLARVGEYALAAIASRRPAAAPAATLYVRQARAHHEAMIGRPLQLPEFVSDLSLLDTGLAGPFLPLLKPIASLMKELDELTVVLAITPEMAAIDVAVPAPASSQLARRFAAMRPGDFALLDRVPERPFVLVAGHVGCVPARGAQRGAADETCVGDIVNEAFDTMTGEVATWLSISGRAFSLGSLVRVSSVRAAEASIRALLARLDKGRETSVMGAPSRLHASSSAVTHDGVVIQSFDLAVDVSRMSGSRQLPVPQRAALEAIVGGGSFRAQLATFDGLGLFVLGTNSFATATRAIDTVRGGRPRVDSRLTDRLLGPARARKDSVIAILDLGAMFKELMGVTLPGDWLAMLSIGYAGRVAHFGVSVPAPLAAGAVRAGATPVP